MKSSRIRVRFAMEKYLAVNLALLKFILKNIVDTLLEQNKYFVPFYYNTFCKNMQTLHKIFVLLGL